MKYLNELVTIYHNQTRLQLQENQIVESLDIDSLLKISKDLIYAKI